jgi:hypothetical protein
MAIREKIGQVYWIPNRNLMTDRRREGILDDLTDTKASVEAYQYGSPLDALILSVATLENVIAQLKIVCDWDNMTI